MPPRFETAQFGGEVGIEHSLRVGCTRRHRIKCWMTIGVVDLLGQAYQYFSTPKTDRLEVWLSPGRREGFSG